jgi:Transposase IS116/IS110/IS902 family
VNFLPHMQTRSDVLSSRMMHVIEDLAGDWRRLDERIEGLSTDIKGLADQDLACERLMTVPGIGPIISSAMVAAIGNGAVFSKGRDFGAWLGQSLPTRPVRPGSLGRAGQAEELGTLRAQTWDRSRQEAFAPQRAGDRARQQAGPHHLGGSQQGTQLRMHYDGCDGAPICLSVAPCSGPSKHDLETPVPEAAKRDGQP